MKLHTYKISDLRDDVFKLLERYSSNGSENDIGESKDILNRFPSCFNRVMRKLCCEFSIYRKKVSLAFEAPCVLQSYEGYELSGDEMLSRNIPKGATAYRIVCSGNGELAFINCGETSAVSISNSVGGISEYKGFILSTGEDSHFLIAGTPRLKVYSFEIYGGFEGSDDELSLLSGGSKCTLKLPEDFLGMCMAYNASGDRVDEDIFDISYIDGTVSVQKEMAGVYTFEYSASHEHYPGLSNLKYEVKLPPMLYDALTYMCAAELCPSYDGEMYSKLTYKYREVLENCYRKERRLYEGRNSFYGVVTRKLKGKKGKVGI